MFFDTAKAFLVFVLSKTFVVACNAIALPLFYLAYFINLIISKFLPSEKRMAQLQLLEAATAGLILCLYADERTVNDALSEAKRRAHVFADLYK